MPSKLQLQLQKSPLSAFLPEEIIQEINHKSICSSIESKDYYLREIEEYRIKCHYTREDNTIKGLKGCLEGIQGTNSVIQNTTQLQDDC